MPNSGLRKYTLNGGLLMLPPPPLAERGLSVSALINSFCLAVCLSGGIGGKRVLSAAASMPGAAMAASNAIANVFLISSSLNVTGGPPRCSSPASSCGRCRSSHPDGRLQRGQQYPRLMKIQTAVRCRGSSSQFKCLWCSCPFLLLGSGHPQRPAAEAGLSAYEWADRLSIACLSKYHAEETQ